MIENGCERVDGAIVNVRMGRVGAVVLVLALLDVCRGSIRDEDERISRLFMKTVDPHQIDKYLTDLAGKMHRAGTAEGLSVADYIHSRFKEFGLKPVEVEEYDVLLSYPNPDQPDEVALLGENGKEQIISNGRSPILEDSESKSKDADLRFLAFGTPGTTSSNSLVYANFGRLEDFEYLRDHGVLINDSVVIIRYGYLWRGRKVQLAQQFGAAGVILYSDPKDYRGFDKQSDNLTFPHNDHLPPSDVQRGTLAQEDTGDVLTPLLPAKSYVNRKSVEQAREEGKLPSIPATVIGYGDMAKLLQEMDGPKAPDSWKGGLPVAYTLGGKFKSSSRIRVTVGGKLERKKIRNVIGYIKGSMEPDRYVILGNHHDAWTYGATDPSSGMASLLEIARVFGTLASEQDWAPKRTLVFCAWDAEEYGVIGSTEWVEQNLRRLQNQAVAYLNVDTAVTGRFAVFARGMPVLKEALFEAARRTQNPNEEELKLGVQTVFDSWSRSTKSTEPKVDTLVGSGSDYKPFMHYAGIPIMDLRYGSSDRTYPLYHTLHDTLFLVKKFVDPTFAYHQAVSRLCGEFARILADSPIVPFNLLDYAKDLQEQFKQVDSRISSTLYPFKVDLAPIVAGLEVFKQAATTFVGKAQSLRSQVVWSTDITRKYSEIRMLNDRMVLLDRFFIQPQGTPNRQSIRHVLYGPGYLDSYSGVLLPGVDEVLQMSLTKDPFRTDSLDTQDIQQMLAEQISWVAACLNAAADWLNRDF